MVARGLSESREMAQRLISAGRVRSGTTVFVKASQMVSEDAELVVSEPERYVSRGGLKLEGALSSFGVDPTGRACLDLGASTGGFTDCLLQHGAASVLAVDVGRAQLHAKLRNDPRVTLMEGTNARALPELEIANDEVRISEGERGDRIANDEFRIAEGEPAEADVQLPRSERRNSQFVIRNSISLFVADLSFISLRKVLPSVAGRVAPGTEGVVLLKPQFEAGPKDVPRGGVIKDASVLERVRREFLEWLEGTGWHVYGIIASPIRGGDGNTEYLVHLGTPVDHRDTEGTEGTD